MTDYKKLVEALRDCASGDDERCFKCAYHKASNMPCHNVLMTDAADAIEAMLPKWGEWVGVSPMVDTVQCSVCGGQLFSAELETPYCPYCGAKMEVQDGD